MNWLRLSNVILSSFIAGLFGYAVKPIIYSWNKPLGYSYAEYMSYVMAILLSYLLNIRLMDFSSQKDKEKKI